MRTAILNKSRNFRLTLPLAGLTIAGLAVLGSFAPGLADTSLSSPPVLAQSGRQRIVFADGRTLDVLGITISEGRATLRTEGGHIIAFSADRILKVEALPEPPATVPEAAPAPPVATVEACPAEPGPESETTPSLSATDDGGLEAIIRDAAAEYDLEVDLLAAVIAVESGYRSDAVSPKGAQGLMQLMPATAKDLAVVDPFNPRENVFAGARYLRELLDKNGDQYWRALAAYNAGSGRVARYDGLPPYKETIAYIRKVIDLYAKPRPIPPALVGR